MACRPCHPSQRLPIAVIVVGLALHTPAAFAQIDPRTALLETAGWDALSAGEARTAAGHFGAALVGDPRNARLHLGAALAAYLEKRDQDARASAERALALDPRSEEHTSELQSQSNLVCRLLLEKKKKKRERTK